MNNRLTTTRLVLAVISNILQLFIIWVIWRWVLPQFDVHLSVTVLVCIMAGWAVMGTGIFLFSTPILKKKVDAGQTTMVGLTGTVVAALAPEGTVKIRGELWRARAAGNIPAGEKVLVVGQEGLKLTVRRPGD